MAVCKNALVFYGPRDPLDRLWGERERWIQEVAYHKASKRHFAPGHELDDWLEAEREVNEALMRSSEE